MLTRENGMDRYEQPEAMGWAGMKAQELEGKGMDNQEMNSKTWWVLRKIELIKNLAC